MSSAPKYIEYVGDEEAWFIYDIFRQQVEGYINARISKYMPEATPYGSIPNMSGNYIDNPFADLSSMFGDYETVYATKISKISIFELRKIIHRRNYSDGIAMFLERFEQEIPMQTISTMCAELFYLHILLIFTEMEAQYNSGLLAFVSSKILEGSLNVVRLIVEDVGYDPSEREEYGSGRLSAYEIYVFDNILLPMRKLGNYYLKDYEGE